jgi:hypothetical protein
LAVPTGVPGEFAIDIPDLVEFMTPVLFVGALLAGIKDIRDDTEAVGV